MLIPDSLVQASCRSRRHRCIAALLLLLLAIWGCETEQKGDSTTTTKTKSGETADSKHADPETVDSVHPGDWFEDRTLSSGINFRYSTGRDAGFNTILETVGGGIGILDFDSDPRPDLLCAGGGTINRESGIPSGARCGLFRNMKGTEFRDVTTNSGLGLATNYSHGCVCGDLNSDGFEDVFLTCYGLNQLFINQGDGTFLDATPASDFGPAPWNTAAALGDVNGDGELDIFVTAYVDWIPSATKLQDVPAPQSYRPVPDELFLNSANGHFTRISDEAGIRRDGKGLGVIATDLNNDQRIDFYVANDVVENHLYLGSERVTLRDVGESAGVAFNEAGSPEGSMGIDCEDVNGDGQDDLWVTNFEMEDNSLYLNLGEGLFQHATSAFRLAGVGRRQVGFGTGLRDFNGDGWVDLFVVNGHVRYHSRLEPFLQPPVLCRNVDGHGFEDITTQGGTWFRKTHAARGTATGDFDNDGGLDLVISSLTEPVALLYNRHPPDNWIQLQLVGIRSPRLPIGCRISVESFGRTCVRTLKSGSGYLSHSESKILLALDPGMSSVLVNVSWPSGLSESFAAIPSRAESVLIEGRGDEIVTAGGK